MYFDFIYEALPNVIKPIMENRSPFNGLINTRVHKVPSKPRQTMPNPAVQICIRYEADPVNHWPPHESFPFARLEGSNGGIITDNPV